MADFLLSFLLIYVEIILNLSDAKILNSNLVIYIIISLYIFVTFHNFIFSVSAPRSRLFFCQT